MLNDIRHQPPMPPVVRVMILTMNNSISYNAAESYQKATKKRISRSFPYVHRINMTPQTSQFSLIECILDPVPQVYISQNFIFFIFNLNPRA